MTSKQHLLLALEHYGLKVMEDNDKVVQLEGDYQIEVESGFLFKLLWRGEVVAPFDDLDELCRFILQG